MPKRIAVIGSGISGLGAAWVLSREHLVTVYEKGAYVGGHTNTIDVPVEAGSSRTTPVDTGFIVFNNDTYPNLINLFKTLDVKHEQSDMSFGVSLNQGHTEWSSDSVASVFAQWGNVVSPYFWRMLWDIRRFNNEGTALLHRTDERAMKMTLREFLKENNYSDAFRDMYFVPMVAAVWSTPATEMLDFPAMTLIRFAHNHRFMQITGRPQWRTVHLGSRQYVAAVVKTLKDIRLNCAVTRVHRNQDGTLMVLDATGREEQYDEVVFACHGDQVLPLLVDATTEERGMLGLLRYKRNVAVVHRDAGQMPKLRACWASWNYLSLGDSESRQLALTYWMNRLQPFIGGSAPGRDLFVTLNPAWPIKKEHIIREIEYEHPIYTLDTIRAQQLLPSVQGKNHVWFAGAWTNFGFHEDGLTSGLKVAESIGSQCPFPVVDATRIRPMPGTSKL